MRRPRQRVTHDLLDLIEAQRQLGQGLPGEIIAQAVIVVHFNAFSSCRCRYRAEIRLAAATKR